MEDKLKDIYYSSNSKALTLKQFQNLLEEVEKYPLEVVTVFIQIRCTKRRGNSFEKILYLTKVLEYYKIDISKEILYLKLDGNKRLVKKDLQTLRIVLIQFN